MLSTNRVAFVAALSLVAFAIFGMSAEAYGRMGFGGGGGGGGFRAGGLSGGGGLRAGGFGGGFRGGGFSGHRAGGFGGRAAIVGGFSGRGIPPGIVGGRLGRGGFHRGSAMGSRSAAIARFSGQRAGQSIRSGKMGRNTLAAKGGTHRQMGKMVNRGLTTGSMQKNASRASVLRNSAFASASTRNVKSAALANTSFHGKYAGQNWRWSGGWFWRHRHPIIVIGWFGPLFWPYAYWDFIDYTFWPYAYDAFWPYAYDDLYVGVFGPYAYEGPTYATRRVATRHGRRPSTTTAIVCREQAPALTDWPIRQIAQTVQPDQSQQLALNDLKGATAEAVKVLQSACPDELPSTPPGRLEAALKRTETMLQALNIVQPALRGFYDSLNDEQKSRFDVINRDAEIARAARAKSQAPDLSQVCGDQALKVTNAPIERIAQTLNPDAGQRLALDVLNDATTQAANFLKANCPGDQALTPPGRVAAMQQRLNAMLEAIKIVQPALKNFYGLLTDEQKARFNQLASQQS